MRSAIATSDFTRWRVAARTLLAGKVAPREVAWVADGATPGLFDADPVAAAVGESTAQVPRQFVRLAHEAVLHRDPSTHAVLYRVLWRIAHGERVLEDPLDPDARLLGLRVGEVTRDLHKMHAFVRFRQVGEQFVAWYAPDHHIVERASPFFRERFNGMTWTILTPDRSVSWDQRELVFGPGAPRSAGPAGDDLEELWQTYYASIFNPARANPRVMRQHMPARFWPQLPESTAIRRCRRGRASGEHMVVLPPRSRPDRDRSRRRARHPRDAARRRARLYRVRAVRSRHPDRVRRRRTGRSARPRRRATG